MSSNTGPNHVIGFPGGYTRSVGPVIGRFLSELRDEISLDCQSIGDRTIGDRTTCTE